MDKFYKRGEPPTDELRTEALAVLQEIVVERDTLYNEFGEFETFVLESGDVELVADNGDLFRCYIARYLDSTDREERRLIVDDYHPDEDASVQVDAFGNITEEYEDNEVPEEAQEVPQTEL